MLTPNFSDSQHRPAFSNPDNVDDRPDASLNTPSRIFAHDDDGGTDGRDEADPRRHREQVPVDLIDEESMESFPCSDPPSYSHSHV
jgi:hypothetical protein